MFSYGMKISKRISNGIFSTLCFCIVVVFDMSVNSQDVIK